MSDSGLPTALARIAQLELQVTGLQNDLSRARNDTLVASQERDTARGQLNAANAKVQGLTEDLRLANAQISDFTATLEKSKQEVADAKVEVADAVAKARAEVADARAAAEDQIAAAKAQAEAAKTDSVALTELQAKLETVTGQRDSYAHKLDALYGEPTEDEGIIRGPAPYITQKDGASYTTLEEARMHLVRIEAGVSHNQALVLVDKHETLVPLIQRAARKTEENPVEKAS